MTGLRENKNLISPAFRGGEKAPRFIGHRTGLSSVQLFGVTVLAFGIFLESGGLEAQDEPSLEQRVKAAFLVKFGAFVDWPPRPAGSDPKSPFTIGICGDDPFGSYFDEATKRQEIGGRPVQVRRAREVSELADCPVVFIGASEAYRVVDLMAQLRD